MKEDSLHPFIKGLVAVLLLLIPVLGALILKSDPVISPTAVVPDPQSIQTVQTFARFIQTKPELARPAQSTDSTRSTSETSASAPSLEPMNDSQRSYLSHLIEVWQGPHRRDEQWRNEIEKLLYISETTGSLDALDLLNQEIIAGRKDADDVNRSKADQWLGRYLAVEKRENKRKEVSDYFREVVQSSLYATPTPSPEP